MEKKTKELVPSKLKLPADKASQQQQQLKDPGSPKTKNHFIVGIGALAGGLESLEKFFRHMPPESGIAFVVVQHLDPTRHSSMLEIMSRFTNMTVHTAADRMIVSPNTVYLIPPNKNIGIQEGKLYLEEPSQHHGLSPRGFLPAFPGQR
jgi:two-component system, chemotaxis family, CheB/CheR fusion protein